jgi:hypothetical protein
MLLNGKTIVNCTPSLDSGGLSFFDFRELLLGKQVLGHAKATSPFSRRRAMSKNKQEGRPHPWTR